jgi:hypothetical protein
MRTRFRTGLFCVLLTGAGALPLLFGANQAVPPASGSPTCPWELFDFRVDPPAITEHHTVDLLFRASHPAGASIFIDFGGSAGTRTQNLTGGCAPADSLVFSVQPNGVGQITVELRDAAGTARAKATAYVPPATFTPLSITVQQLGQAPTRISNITWSPNTTITLAMLRAQNSHQLSYNTTFYDSFGSSLQTCQCHTPAPGHYWLFSVNHVPARYGMDTLILSPGDEVEIVEH